jgi:hypothetical protein
MWHRGASSTRAHHRLSPVIGPDGRSGSRPEGQRCSGLSLLYPWKAVEPTAVPKASGSCHLPPVSLPPRDGECYTVPGHTLCQPARRGSPRTCRERVHTMRGCRISYCVQIKFGDPEPRPLLGPGIVLVRRSSGSGPFATNPQIERAIEPAPNRPPKHRKAISSPRRGLTLTREMMPSSLA